MGYLLDGTVTVFPEGHAMIFIPFSAQATCNFDYTDFPNDLQECPIVFHFSQVMSRLNFSEYSSFDFMMKPLSWVKRDWEAWKKPEGNHRAGKKNHSDSVKSFDREYTLS